MWTSQRPAVGSSDWLDCRCDMRTTCDKRDEQKNGSRDKLIKRNKNKDQRASRLDVNEERVDIDDRCEQCSNDGCDERYNDDAATPSHSACRRESSEGSQRPEGESAEERLQALPRVCHHAECTDSADRNDCVSDALHRVIERRSPSNIVISRNCSAYFVGLPLISTGNAEERSAFFGGSLSQNRCSPERRKAIFRVSTAAQVARSRARCAPGKSLFGPDRRGIRGVDSAIHSVSWQKTSPGNGSAGGGAVPDASGGRRKCFIQHAKAGPQRAGFSLSPGVAKAARPVSRHRAAETAAAPAAGAEQGRGRATFGGHDWDASTDHHPAFRHGNAFAGMFAAASQGCRSCAESDCGTGWKGMERPRHDAAAKDQTGFGSAFTARARNSLHGSECGTRPSLFTRSTGPEIS